MDECLKRGWTAATRRDIMPIASLGSASSFERCGSRLITLMVVYDVPLKYALIGLISVAVMWAERVTSAWRLRGRTLKDTLLVVIIFVEDLYGFFLELCAVAAAIKCLRAKRQAW